MKKSFEKILHVGLWILIALVVNSCKTEEFRLGEIQLKEEFRTDIVSPVFQGKMEFRDFVNTELASSTYQANTHSIIQYSNGTAIYVPSSSFFEPYIIIPDLSFLIAGSYDLETITLKFMVSNGTPFPLNLKLRFFNEDSPLILGPPITPAAFDEGLVKDGEITSVKSSYDIPLDPEQRQSFMNSDRVQFTTWFDRTNFINNNDTLNAHYPVDISIIMQGIAKEKE